MLISKGGVFLREKMLPGFERIRVARELREKKNPSPVQTVQQEEKNEEPLQESLIDETPPKASSSLGEEKKPPEKKEAIPQEIYTFLRRAEACISRKEYEEATRMLIKVLSWNDDHVGANEHLAFVYLQTGEYSRAENLFRKVIETRPKDPSLLTNFALSVFHQNKSPEDMKDSLLALQRAAEIDNKNPVRFANLGQSLFSVGDVASAAEAFEKAIRFSPRNIEYLFFLANSYLALDRFGEAKQVFSKILDISPLNENARREYEELRKKGF